MSIFSEDSKLNLYLATLGQTPEGKADANVKIGGESITKFVPNINASKWRDECWFNINNKNVAIKAETQNFQSGKIDLIVGNDCHRYYITPEGKLEYEIIFSIQPKPEVLLELQHSKNLDFLYQPELSVHEIADGHIRPENVVGSYAVYAQKVNGNYQTGKLCHIYRPKFIDARGFSTWGTLFIDPSAGVISIRCDEDWLKKASYPVTLDPDLGYSTLGASAVFHSYGAATAVHGTTDGSGGDTARIYIGVYSGAAGSCKMAVYTDDAGNNRPESQLPDGSGDDEVSVSLSATGWVSAAYVQSLAASTKYWIACADLRGSVTYWNFDYGSSNICHCYSLGSTDLPATWANSGINSNLKFSQYVDYASAGGPVIPVFMNQYRQRWAA